MTILEQVYASNTQKIYMTAEFIHPALQEEAGTYLKVVQSDQDLVAFVDGVERTFTAYNIKIKRPERDSDGAGSTTIEIANVNDVFWSKYQEVENANATTQSEITLKLREYVASDLSAPQISLGLTVSSVTFNERSAIITAIHGRYDDKSWPIYRYYPKQYQGVKYV